MNQIVVKSLATWKNPKKSVSRCGCIPKFSQLFHVRGHMQFSWRSGQYSLHVKLLTDRQKDRQTKSLKH